MTESPTDSASRSGGARGFSPADAAAAKARLIAQGKTYAEWADEHGFNRRMVYEVLAGRRRCYRGASHKIAVALGLKSEPRSERLEGLRP